MSTAMTPSDTDHKDWPADIYRYFKEAKIRQVGYVPDAGHAALIRMCEELNVCFAGECYLAMIMHTRAIIDHVPPIFNCKTFAEVASSYGGTRSFKEATVCSTGRLCLEEAR